MKRKDIISLIFLGLIIISNLFFLQRQLEIFLFDVISQPSNILVAQVNQDIKAFSSEENSPTPLTKPAIPEFGAKSVISLIINQDGSEKILYQKSIQERLPIASLTKLMTALVSVENYFLNQKIEISQEAVSQEGDAGKLIVGESISVKNLLFALLIESSNDVAFALAENINLKQFIEKMNLKAAELGMLNTNFVNATGLNGSENYSTIEDLVKLMRYIIWKQPQILEISSKNSVEILNEDGTLHHISVNTNELLGKISGIIGGKTGFNEEALGCLILVLKNENQEYSINIILGSPDRFSEMENLINWLKESNLY